MSRALIWVQSLLGSGHLRRALVIADALAGEGFAVTVANGGPPPSGPCPAGVDLVQLPPVRAGDAGFGTLVDADGAPVSDALFAERAARLRALVAETAPRVLLTELFPFGRRAFHRELLPLLEALAGRRERPLLVASVRDILVAPADPARPRAAAELARRLYDLVLVHADPRLVPFGHSFPAARMLWDRLRYTGYVCAGATGSPAPLSARRGVLVTGGGGRVAGPLLEVALAAARRDPAGEPWRLVAGPDLDDDAFAALARRARGAPVRLVRADPDLPRSLAAARVVVARSGYNTVVEALAAATPLVAVPFETGRETEQRTRAERLAALGFARLVPETALTPEALLAAVDALRRAPPRPPRLLLDGARRTARLLREVWARREGRP